MKLRRVLGAALLSAVFSAASTLAVAQDQARNLMAGSANVHGHGSILAFAGRGGMPATVADFLRAEGVGPRTIASLVISGKHASPNLGTTHLRMSQQVGGLSVYGTYVKASFDSDGNLIHLIENLARTEGGVVPAGIGAREALDAALDRVHPDQAVSLGESGRSGDTVSFGGDDFFHRDPTVTNVAIAMGNGALHEGYLVETWTEDGNLLHHTLVGGNGRVLGVQLRTNNDSYNVFVEHPGVTDQAPISGPGAGGGDTSSPSPYGWLEGSQTTVHISGNNASAYLDTDANNAPDGGGTPVGSGVGLDFLIPWDGTVAPDAPGNDEVAVQNLFYWNNVIHDTLYLHGFVEAVGNFQEDNFTNGGLGGDSVNAEAQDGSGTDNANFATPSDGSNPRMQMFLWNGKGDRLVTIGTDAYLANSAGFGPSGPFSGSVALVNDGVDTATDGCESLVGFSGGIALVDRGSCDFVVKVKNAEDAGASGVIVVNNQGDDILTMGGTDNSIIIPSVFIGQTDGDAIKVALPISSASVSERTVLMRDGDLDSDIIWHEYGHGLTWRMIGNMSGDIAGAIGEGMSDVLAILANDNDVVGEYSSSSSLGIRSAPYTGYSRTYGDMTGDSIHYDGEIYAAAIWHLWELFQLEGISKDTLYDYLVGGMNFTPSGPAMEDMRDGILAAAPSKDDCLIWEAFAAFGIGEGASGSVRGGGPFGGNLSSITQSFAVPAECETTSGGDTTNPVVSIEGPTNANTYSTSSASVTLTGTASDNVGVTEVTWTNIDNDFDGFGTASGSNNWSADINLVAGENRITVTAHDAAGNTGSDTLSVTYTTGSGATMHVHALEGFGRTAPRGNWTAEVTVTIADNGEVAVPGAVVDGAWGGGAKGRGSCTTDGNGECTVAKSNLKSSLTSVDFTVTDVSGSLPYDPAGNDADSSATVDQPSAATAKLR